MQGSKKVLISTNKGNTMSEELRGSVNYNGSEIDTTDMTGKHY